MLEGGEDPRFIARRMVIFASEDVGNADPQALRDRQRGGAGGRSRRAARSARSTSPRRPPTWRSHRSRTPQRRAISRASAHVREHGAAEPPPYLQDAHYPGARKLGRGEGYRYPHDEPERGQPTSRSRRRRCGTSASTSRRTAASRRSSASASSGCDNCSASVSRRLRALEPHLPDRATFRRRACSEDRLTLWQFVRFAGAGA